MKLEKWCLAGGSYIRYLLTSSVGMASACNAGDLDSIPGLARSAGERIAYPFQCPWALPLWLSW